MNIGMVVVAYNSGPDLIRLVGSVNYGDCMRLELFLHSEDEATVVACEKVVMALGSACNFHDIRRNAGLARAWNEGVLNCYEDGADAVIIANDDIVFGDGDLRRMAETAMSHPENFIVVCGGYHERRRAVVPSHGYSCFALQPVALDVLGCFDENLFPAYFEDCDYGRRAALAGLGQAVCEGTSVSHFGSGTINRDAELNHRNHDTFTRNKNYYGRKWGGSNGEETFNRPWNNPSISLRIDLDSRHTPYGPPYDRVNPAVTLDASTVMA